MTRNPLQEAAQRIAEAITLGAARDGLVLPEGWAQERGNNAAASLMDLLEPEEITLQPFTGHPPGIDRPGAIHFRCDECDDDFAVKGGEDAIHAFAWVEANSVLPGP